MAEWRVVGRSIRGSSHERGGGECQDACDVRVVNGAVVIVVADGAGSASQGGLGAECAVRAAMESLVDALSQPQCVDPPQDSELLMRAAIGAREKVLLVAQELVIPARDLACTLICAVAQESSVSALQIGDGAVIVREGPGRMTLVTRPQRGEFVNVTIFLTSEGAIEGAELAKVDGKIRAVAAITDGLEPISLSAASMTPYEPFFQQVFDWMSSPDAQPQSLREQLGMFLSSERVRVRTEDDVTLVAAVALP